MDNITNQTKVIEANGLSAGYKGKAIWQKASFDVKAGEFIGLLGPNGAGKTTLLKLLLGLIKPSSGELKVLGKQPTSGNPKIGYIPQGRFIDNDSKLSAIEYVKLSLHGNAWGFSGPSKNRKDNVLALESLKRVDALSLAYRPLSELSGGERQRIFLAQALVSQPDILLLDEPLASLDIRRSTQLIRLIHNVAKKDKIAVILIAHDINPLLPVIDRIIYLANGKVANGKVSEVITSQSLSKLYNANIEVLSDSRGRLAVVGIEEAAHHDH